MKKNCLIIALLSIVLLSGCMSGGEKTEIKIQLSEPEYIFSLVQNKSDSVFLAAYDHALTNYNPEKSDFLSLLENEYSGICPDCKLASLFNSFELSGVMSYDMSGPEVVSALNGEVKRAMDTTVSILAKRIGLFCKPSSGLDKLLKNTVVEVAALPEKNTWSFTVNRKVDAERLTKLLESHIKCGFWETYELKEIWDYLAQANKLLSDPSMAEYTGIMADTSQVQGVLFSVLSPAIDMNGELMKGSTIGYSKFGDIPLFNDYMSLSAISNIFPRDLKLMWGPTPGSKNKEILSLIAARTSTRDGLPILGNDYIVEASSGIKNYPPVLTIRMNNEGARIFSRLTRDNIDRQIVFEVNNSVFSLATVLDEITDGAFSITGDYTEEEITDLAIILNSGTAPDIGIKVISIL